MKCFLFIIFLSACFQHVNAQELPEPIIVLPDSLQTPCIERQGTIPDAIFFTTLLPPTLTMQFPGFQAPAFNITKFMNQNKTIEYMTISDPVQTSFHFFNPAFHFPYIFSGTIFNQAAYQINDKLILGGNSFGVNSIFSPSIVHPMTNQWQTRGASLFMQYKVNRNFKIETRISVTGTPNYP